MGTSLGYSFKTNLNEIKDTVEVTVENVRVSKSDCIGVYEVNESPGSIASIWWMWTRVKDGTVKFTHDSNKMKIKARYKEGSTYNLILLRKWI